LLLQFIHF